MSKPTKPAAVPENEKSEFSKKLGNKLDEAQRLLKDARAEAQKEAQRLVADARALLVEAEKIADEFGISFNFSVAYGMGGTYVGCSKENAESGYDTGWISSSNNC